MRIRSCFDDPVPLTLSALVSLQHASDAMVVHDGSLIAWANLAAARCCRALHPSELLGMPIGELFSGALPRVGRPIATSLRHTDGTAQLVEICDSWLSEGSSFRVRVVRVRGMRAPGAPAIDLAGGGGGAASVPHADLWSIAAKAMRLAGSRVSQRASVQMLGSKGHCTAVPEAILVRVLINLLLHAADAFPAASRSSNRIDLVLIPRGDRLWVEVTDNGPGVPRHPVGSGLGLAVSRDLMARAGGELTLVETRPGNTRFRVDLAAAPCECEADAAVRVIRG